MVSDSLIESGIGAYYRWLAYFDQIALNLVSQNYLTECMDISVLLVAGSN